MHPLAQLDHRYIWHPFTQMQDWLAREPIMIVSGKDAVLRDVHGNEYLDANASIWTNVHGHNHPKINAAIRRQLKKIAHSSALGLANEPAALLAEMLVQAVNSMPISPAQVRAIPIILDNQIPIKNMAKPRTHCLSKVFFSDDGSTAMEVALKLAYEYARRTGLSQHPRFLSLSNAYHGDTIGAVSLGHIDLFHKSYSGLVFETDRVMAPYCYRCPFNRARPERADARVYRQCAWECVDQVQHHFEAQRQHGNPCTAMVVEPLIQGAAGMIPQPPGWLARVGEIVRANQALLIADEVMTGFGRTGVLEHTAHESGNSNSLSHPQPGSPSWFACQQEQVQPDLMAVAKGLTGGYLPMAATFTTQSIFNAFLGEYSEFKTFFHGHSFTANQLGCAAALASLELLSSATSIRARQTLQETLRQELAPLWSLPQVGDIRQVGFIVGIELVRDWTTRQSYPLTERVGIRVCDAMARRGVLTRPIGNVIVLMPPYCMTAVQARRMITALVESIQEELG